MVIFNNVIVSFQGCKGQVFASKSEPPNLKKPPFQFDEKTVKKFCKKQKLTTFLRGGLLKLQKKSAFSLENIRFFVPDWLVLRVSSWWTWTATAVFPGPKKCCVCWFIPKVNSNTSRLLCCLGKSPVETWNSETTVKTFARKFDEWPPKNGPKIMVWVSCFLKTPYFRVSNGIYENDFQW